MKGLVVLFLVTASFAKPQLELDGITSGIGAGLRLGAGVGSAIEAGLGAGVGAGGGGGDGLGAGLGAAVGIGSKAAGAAKAGVKAGAGLATAGAEAAKKAGKLGSKAVAGIGDAVKGGLGSAGDGGQDGGCMGLDAGKLNEVTEALKGKEGDRPCQKISKALLKIPNGISSIFSKLSHGKSSHGNIFSHLAKWARQNCDGSDISPLGEKKNIEKLIESIKEEANSHGKGKSDEEEAGGNSKGAGGDGIKSAIKSAVNAGGNAVKTGAELGATAIKTAAKLEEMKLKAMGDIAGGLVGGGADAKAETGAGAGCGFAELMKNHFHQDAKLVVELSHILSGGFQKVGSWFGDGNSLFKSSDDVGAIAELMATLCGDLYKSGKLSPSADLGAGLGGGSSGSSSGSGESGGLGSGLGLGGDGSDGYNGLFINLAANLEAEGADKFIHGFEDGIKACDCAKN